MVVSKFCWNVWSSNLSIFSRHCHVHRLPTQWTWFFQLPSTVQDPEYGSIYSFFLLQLAKMIMRQSCWEVYTLEPRLDTICSHTKGKASTAKQTCLGSLLGLKLNLYCVLILFFWRHPCQLDLSRHHRATRPNYTIEMSFPDSNVTRSGRIGLNLGCGCHL